MELTFSINSFGHLHVFEGDIIVNRNNPSNHLGENGEESVGYFQNDTEVLSTLSFCGFLDVDIDFLIDGYPIVKEISTDRYYSLINND